MDRSSEGKNGKKIEARRKRQDTRGKMQWVLLLASCILLITSVIPVYAANKPITRGDEPPVAERIIKIEGNVEKPRVIFIIPRAKIWKDDIFKKSFIPDILRPVNPRLLIKEEGIDKTIRR